MLINNIKNILLVLIPIISYLSTTVFLNSHFIIIAVLMMLLLIIINSDINLLNNRFKYRIILFVILICWQLLSLIINFISVSNRVRELADVWSIFPFNILCYVVFMVFGYTLTKEKFQRVNNILVYCISMEILVGTFLLFTGNQSYIVNSIGGIDAKDEYLMRGLFALSNNTSIIGYKIMIFYWLIYIMQNKYRLYAYFVVFIPLIFTYNRASLMVVICILYLDFIKNYRKIKLKYVFYITLLLILVLFCINSYLEFLDLDLDVLLSFFRFDAVNDKIDFASFATGRDLLWEQALEFISNNMLFGNYNIRYLADYNSGLSHVHNSHLETIATYGLIYYLLLMINIILLSIKSKYKLQMFLLFVCLYSNTQYGVFWGLSFLDFIFWSLLGYRYTKV